MKYTSLLVLERNKMKYLVLLGMLLAGPALALGTTSGSGNGTSNTGGITVSGAVTPNNCVSFLSSNVIQDSGSTCGSGGGSATLADTTSAVNYYLGMTTTTSGSLSTLYGTASKLFFNASTGILTTPAITLSSSTTGIAGINGVGVVSSTATTGSGSVVLATTPTLVTPVLGAATGTSVTWSGNDTAAAFVPTGSTIPSDGYYLKSSNTSAIADRSLEAIEFTNPASAVNFWKLTGSATGVAPSLTVGGTDTNGVGIGVAINALTATATGVGGGITLTSGQGFGAGSGGTIAINAGAGSASGNGPGGPINLTAGNGTASSSAGGSITLTAGNAVTTSTGGNINLTAGNGAASTSGAVNLTGGAGNGGQVGGVVAITGGAGGGGSTGGTSTLKGGAGNAAGAGGAALVTGGTAGVTGAGGAVTLTSANGGATSGVAGSINLTLGTTTSSAGGALPSINAGGELAFTTTQAALPAKTGAHMVTADVLALSTSGVDRVTVDSTGLVAIPFLATDATHTDSSVCQDTTTHALYSGSGTLGVCLGTSSARYKHDVVSLPLGLKELAQLKPISFYYNKGRGDNGAKLQYGFLAEDMAEVFPKLVDLDRDGKPNSVDLVGLIPVLVHAVQEQQKEIDALKKKVRQ